jgi:hypothetical protein
MTIFVMVGFPTFEEDQNMSARDRLLSTVQNIEPNQTAGMHVRRARYVRISVADLMDVCQESPDHPQARVYMQACSSVDAANRGMVSVDAVDLQALLESRTSSLVMSKEDGRIVERKALS